ncbi:alpha/beta fold hydrolase [Streptomyces sp. NPDC017979]|uniref:alpha/beta fold hydrolase n=1 Tax=Streptomyces sp. NPDC017979 TaxID=3365024 RepID=UPI00379472DA
MTLAHDLAGPTGSARNVVLLHSTVCDRRMWDAQLPALAAAGNRVVRADFRGYGETPCAGAPDEPAADDADDVLALMDAVGMARAVLIGASFGGRTALEIALRAPERVTGLALLCPGPLPGVPESAELTALEEREVELVQYGDLDEAAALCARTFLGPEADGATLAAVAAMQLHAYEVQLATADEPPAAADFDVAALADVSVPALVVSGAHDLVDFRTAARRAAAALPGAHHRELEWAGHLPSLERPAEVTGLLVDFLDAVYPDAVTSR